MSGVRTAVSNVSLTGPGSNSTQQALPTEYLVFRHATLLLNLLGTALCSAAVSVFHKKYLATRDAFEFGLLLLQWLQVLYCGLASGYVSLDLAIRILQMENQPELLHLFQAFYSLTCAALILKNLWTLCVSCFRSAATIRPLAFRTFLTVKFQLGVFALLLFLAVACAVFSFVCAYAVPEADREQVQIRYMLPLIRVTQSYVPVFGIMITSDVLAIYLCMYRRQARQLNMATAAGRRSFQRQSARATCIVLCLSLSFTAFEAPGAVVSLMKNLTQAQISLWYLISDVLVSLDSNFNFFVFLSLSSNFRAALLCSLRRCLVSVTGGRYGDTGALSSANHMYASVAAPNPRLNNRTVVVASEDDDDGETVACGNERAGCNPADDIELAPMTHQDGLA